MYMYTCNNVRMTYDCLFFIANFSDMDDGPADAKRPCLSVSELPHYYFLHLLLSNTSSLWKESSKDSNEIASWSRCNEYFEFLVHLLQGLTGTCTCTC